jgi:aminopeptidase I
MTINRHCLKGVLRLVNLPDLLKLWLPNWAFKTVSPNKIRSLRHYYHNLVSSILSWELELFQCEPGTFGGLSREFIFAPRIDDKLCSWAAIEGLIIASKDLSDRGTINMCALYDNEETGSESKQGAKSNLMSMHNSFYD